MSAISPADGKRFIVRADEKLTAFLELEAAIRGCGELELPTPTDEHLRELRALAALVASRC
jgi:hypothetical protein